jgi:hypothetical protein
LPDLAGLGVVRFVRAHKPIASIPVIILSRSEPVPEALNLGASDWLKSQDITVDDLVNKVFYHLITNKILI